jgi:hypothetical protein
MALGIGEAIKEDFLIIKSKVISPRSVGNVVYDAENPVPECCFELTVLAELVYTSAYFNDKTAFSFDWNNGFSTAVMVLQKSVNGSWVNKATLTDYALGTYYAFGFYTTIYSEKKIGFLLDWASVLSGFDEGIYRVKCTGTPIIGDPVIVYSPNYSLLKYTTHRADATVRIEWWKNGNAGNQYDDSLKTDFGTLNWYNQIRLYDSKFGNDTSTFERTYIKYQNGKKTWTNDQQIEEYVLKTGRFNNELHRFIKIDILQADEIRVTDYNSENANEHIDRWVIPSSNYEPRWLDGSKFAPVEVKFQQLYQNHEHKRC